MGAVRSSVQLAKKALNSSDEAIPRVFEPVRFIKYLKEYTVKIAIEKEVKPNIRFCRAGVYPIEEPIKKMGKVTKMGCKIEEKMATPKSVKEITARTNRRSIRAPLKPRKKNLIQRFRAPRSAQIKLPRISTPNHTTEE
jgi:hypothetical protein